MSLALPTGLTTCVFDLCHSLQAIMQPLHSGTHEAGPNHWLEKSLQAFTAGSSVKVLSSYRSRVRRRISRAHLQPELDTFFI